MGRISELSMVVLDGKDVSVFNQEVPEQEIEFQVESNFSRQVLLKEVVIRHQRQVSIHLPLGVKELLKLLG